MSVRKLTSNYEQRASRGRPLSESWKGAHQPGRAINPVGYELDSELDMSEENIGMSQAELDDYNIILSNNEIKSLGMSTMEIEAEKRGQRWRNLSYIFFKNHHNITFPELQER